MKDALKGYLALAGGLSEVTRQRAVGAAKALVAQGEATAGQVTSLADDLLVQSRSNREAVTALVKYEVDRALGRVGLASNDEVGELTARIRALEGSVRELHRDLAATGHGNRAPTKTAPTKTAPTKTAPTKTAPTRRTPVAKAAGKTSMVKAASRTTAGPRQVRVASSKTAAVTKVPAARRGAKAPTPPRPPTATARTTRGA